MSAYISCPSKVLIMGGYAILDPMCVGISLATDIKFSANVTTQLGQEKTLCIQIDSQGMNKVYKYTVEGGQVKSSEENPFLLASIEIFFSYLERQEKVKQFSHISIQLMNQPGFYSGNDKKTGLGSSSCCVVTTIGALLLAYSLYNDTLLNYLAQQANNRAQNKIGSGFDIKTCIFGSQLFRKNDKKSIENSQYIDLTPYTFDPKETITFPKDIKLFLLDVSTGSDTRILVKNVQTYLNKNPQEKQHFYENSNSCCEKFLHYLKDPQSQNIREVNRQYRETIQQLSKKSGVEIEPDMFTQLLDGVLNRFEEVLYGGCPGAGGYDAACLLVKKDFDKQLLESYIGQTFPEWEVSVMETGVSNSGVEVSRD